jgi:hypothetical protein
LSPPFKIRQVAAAWIASGIDPFHCIAVVDRHLKQHAASRSSGSADGLLPYLDKLIRHQWENRHGAPTRQPQTRPKPGNALDRWDDYRAKQRSDEPDCEGNYGGQ